LSDQLCHLCGAGAVPATFASHTDADRDPYTHIHAHGHLDADCYRYTDGHGDTYRHAHRNRDADHGATDGYRYPIALGHSHHCADGYIHWLSYAHADTTAPYGDALGHPHFLATLQAPPKRWAAKAALRRIGESHYLLNHHLDLGGAQF
jgi:hypothetical protein